MQYFLGTSELRSNIILWAIIIYLIIFFVIVPIHRKLRKKRLAKEQEIVKDVDEMIYLLAKAQHDMNIDIRKL
jgi:cellulose synthase/poly-beta-1,6-N-acetylglucosamine synthase-like glycosyltransferase